MVKKLFRVRTSGAVMVLAEDAYSAERIAAREAGDDVKWTAEDVTGESPVQVPEGWTSKTLVYQTGRVDRDISLEEAIILSG